MNDAIQDLPPIYHPADVWAVLPPWVQWLVVGLCALLAFVLFVSIVARDVLKTFKQP